MSSKLFLAVVLASSSLAVAASAGDKNDAGGAKHADGKTTVCHRTSANPAAHGNELPRDLFPGQVITVSNSSVLKHHTQHGDIVVAPGVVSAFSFRPFCFSDAEGNLYDQMGDLVQSVNGNGDNEGPGGGGGPG